jgi:hypothetical protein
MNQRRPFISVAAIVSLLLPLVAIVEWTAFSFTGYWWFAYPAQLLIAGLLGLAVAISRRGWWWLLGAWGAVLTGSGVLTATVPFWAK